MRSNIKKETNKKTLLHFVCKRCTWNTKNRENEYKMIEGFILYKDKAKFDRAKSRNWIIQNHI